MISRLENESISDTGPLLPWMRALAYRPTEMSEWYYAHDGEQKGPVPVSELRRLADDGNFDPQSDLVWREGMDDWKPAGTVAELKGAFEPSPSATDGLLEPSEPFVAADPAPAAPRAVSPVGTVTAAPSTPATSGQAIASLVCGIVGLFTCIVWCLGLPLALVAIVMGHLASAKIKSSPDRFAGKGLARTGLVTGYVGLLGSIAALAFGLWIQSLSPEEIRGLDWLPPEARESIIQQIELRQGMQRPIEEGGSRD
jgi:hypothetical protein